MLGVLFLTFIAYAKSYGEVAQQLTVFRILLIYKIILQRHLGQPFHISHHDKIGLRMITKSANAQSNDNAADDEEVNSNDDGQSKQYCCSRKSESLP